MLKFFIALVFVCCYVFVKPCQQQSSSSDQELLDWISSSSTELLSVDVGSDFQDLEPLKPKLHGAQIVGLGEATHGTREFFLMKNRLIEFLIKEMGFTAVAFEAGYPECERVNAYIHGADDDVNEVVHSIGYWVWDTQEVSALVEWLREYNKTVEGDKKVSFYGVDLQRPTVSIEVISDYLKRVAPEYLEQCSPIFDEVTEVTKVKAYHDEPEEVKAKLYAQILEIVGFLSFNEPQFVQKTSQEEFERVLQHARILVQFQQKRSKNFMLAFQDESKARTNALRDKFMADNVEWIRNRPSKPKVVIWAHNGHVSSSFLDGRWVPSMGSYLKEAYASEYYSVGFTFREGSFRARDIDPKRTGIHQYQIKPSQDGVDYYLAQSGYKLSFLDLRSAPDSESVNAWLDSEQKMWSVGAVFSDEWAQAGEESMGSVRLRNAYDGLIYVDKTEASRPNDSKDLRATGK